jgi:putative transposase
MVRGLGMKTLNPGVARVLKRLHYPLEVILRCVRWYVAYPPGLRHLEETMAERGNAVDFLLRARRNRAAAQSYIEKSIQQNGVPETVTTGKSGANLAALHPERDTPIKIRQVKYLNNLVEQDHRLKRIIRPMLGFRDFRCARVILSGIEIMHTISKGQLKHTGKIKPSAASHFYPLVT